MEEEIRRLSAKERLDGDDASSLLQLLQDQATPVLSSRSLGSSPVTSTRQPIPRRKREQQRAKPLHPVERGGRKNGGRERVTINQAAEEALRSRRKHRGANHSESRRGRPGSPSELQSVSEESESVAVLDVNSLEDFPPMEKAMLESSRKKEKSLTPRRRITLTPVPSGPNTTQFSLPSPWSTHPAFITGAATTDTPSPLSEERKLLRQERSRHGGSKNQRRPATHSGKEVQVRSQSLSSSQRESVGKIHSVSSAMKPAGREVGREQQCSEQSPSDGLLSHDRCGHGGHSRGLGGSVSSRAFLDARISGHMIHDLSGSQKKVSSMHISKEWHLGEPVPHERNVNRSHTGSLDLGPSDSTACALTSTPLPMSACHNEVSVSNVSNKESLESAVELYSMLILDRLVPNLTSEINFLVQLLTATIPAGPVDSLPCSEQIFQSIDNCVYFAVAVLSKTKRLLSPLDKATLQLLSENTRVKQLQPELSDFCARALEKASTEVTTGQRPLLQSAFERVPFREDTDNIKNFPNMKVFHAFKKQRDSFYSILREWETHHEDTNWQFHLALGSKIRQLVGQPPELCSLDHLARLFQKQLLESCGYAAHIALGVGSLEGRLKHINPDKLIKLSERFMQQSSGSGTCQPPKFCHAEVFFSEFLTIADSSTLNHHLTAVMYRELTKFHSRCATVDSGEVPEILHTMRVLAKFLGFIEFLPYSNFSSSFLPARNAMAHPSVIAQCVLEARERGHLCLTIPWVVEYLSMMDSQALQVPQYHNLLCQLMDVYRTLSVEDESVDVDSFLVLACLGWLFETPNISSSFFFEYLKSKKSPNTTTVVPLSGNKTNLVSRELLYTCCPFLTGIRTILAEFAAGLHSRTSPIRKIKPISAEIDKPQISLSSQIQIKLQDSFFRSHPPYLKQLCDIVSERVGEAAIALIQNKTVPEHTINGTQILAGWVAAKCLVQQTKESSLEVVDLFYNHDAARMLSLVTEQVFTSASKDAMTLCREHCQTHTEKALNVLLCDLVSSQVTAAVVSITSKWALDKCLRWMDMKLRDIVCEKVASCFGGLKRTLKAGTKENQSHSHFTTSLEMSSTANSTANLCQVSFSVELSSASLSNVHSSKLPQVPLLGPVDSPEGSIVSSIAQEYAESPVSHYIKVVRLMIKNRESCPSADELMSVKSASGSLNTYIVSKTTIIPGVCSPELLPNGVEDLIETSVELAVYLVSHGVLSPCSEYVPLVEDIVSLWVLLKNLKQKIPIHTVLNRVSVALYLQQAAKGVTVWTSLNCLLMKSILCNAVTTFVVEALWLCRLQQLRSNQKQDFMDAASAFVNSWYSHSTEPHDCSTVSQVCAFKEVCFVRLLSVVVKESDCSNLPSSLTNHPSLSFLSL